MVRQINLVCDFMLGYLKCELLEDILDVDVKIRTFRGMIHLKKTETIIPLSSGIGEVRLIPLKLLK